MILGAHRAPRNPRLGYGNMVLGITAESMSDPEARKRALNSELANGASADGKHVGFLDCVVEGGREGGLLLMFFRFLEGNWGGGELFFSLRLGSGSCVWCFELDVHRGDRNGFERVGASLD